MPVEEHTITLDDQPVFYLSAGEAGPLYIHGIPTSSDDWIPFLERIGGVAPDLIGFGRSGKGGHLDYTPGGLAAFLDGFADRVGADRSQIVAHGWGVVAAALLASTGPDQIEKLVLISPPQALPGYTWNAVQRAWRMPVIGELVMGSITKTVLARALRRVSAAPDTWPRPRVNQVWDQFDQGTERAILRLHRAWGAPSAQRLQAALAGLTMPALLVWGDADPWCPSSLAHAYAAQLPQVSQKTVPGAGHWPWLDQQTVVEQVADWLAG